MKHAILCLVLLAACRPDVGPTGKTVGAPCTGKSSDYSCDEICLTFRNVGVMCTMRCRTDLDCLVGTACTDIPLANSSDRACAPRCETDNECAAYNRGFICIPSRSGSDAPPVCRDPRITSSGET
jgi:hypothetical protein